MAGQIIGGGGYTGGSEDMSSPPGSEQDYCNDSKRKRKCRQMKDTSDPLEKLVRKCRERLN